MALPFYNQGDQDIYAGGEHFIPQQQYRLNYTPSQSLASTVGNTGITNTQAASPYKWPPQGGGGGGGLNTNKFGLDMSTLKTIDSGKWTGSEYEKTGRKIAKTEGGIWKDINTGQNVYHANINVKTPIQSIFGAITGKKTTGDPYADTWTGAKWEDEFDESVAKKNLNTYQRWKAKKEFKAAEAQKAAADQVRADVAAAKPSLRAQSEANRAANTGGWQSGMAKDEGFMTGAGTSDEMASFAQGGRTGYQDGELVTDESMMEATPAGMMEENIEEVQGEPTREQLEAIALEIFRLPLEELNEEQLNVVYQAAMEQEPSEEEVQFAAQEGPGEGIASLV